MQNRVYFTQDEQSLKLLQNVFIHVTNQIIPGKSGKFLKVLERNMILFYKNGSLVLSQKKEF